MAYYYQNQAFNLHVGDDPGAAQDNDKSKIIGNLLFPDLNETTTPHRPGGSRVGINWGGMGMEPLVVRFSTNGWDPQTLSQFGIFASANIFYTLRASVRNRNGDIPVAVVCIVRGRLTKATAASMTRGSMFSFDYEINEIDSYQLTFDGKPKYNFSLWGNTYEVDGVSQNDDEKSALGIS